jgi:hypothetical protein
MKRFILGSMLAALCAASGPNEADGGTTRYVDNLKDCGGLAPCYRTIMDAVDAAVPLDTIEVFPGVYHETVVFTSKGQIVLRGHGEGGMPTIVAPAGANAIVLRVSSGIQLIGLILEAPDGAGVLGEGRGVQDVIIEGNLISAPQGISLVGGSGTIRNNTITEGGIDGAGSIGCRVEGNTVIGGIGFSEWNGGPVGNHVLSNVLLGGGINFNGRPANSNLAESNVVLDGDIRANGYFCWTNTIRANVVRGGGIQMGFGAERNTIEGNFTSGSPGDGILVNIPSLGGGGGNNSILRNTSVDNAGCDLNDTSEARYPANHWEENRHRIACGAAGSPTP